MKYILYPDDWPDIAYSIKEANDWRCMQCNRQCRRPGELYLGWEYTLTVAHICQNYEADAVYVAPLCAPCHLLFDSVHSWLARRRKRMVRLRLAGQLEIFPTWQII